MTLYTIQYRRWGRLLSLPRLKSFENKRKWHSKGDNEKGHTYLVVRKGLRLEGGHVDLFVALALLAEGAVWQLAPFVGHEVAALGEGQIL